MPTSTKPNAQPAASLRKRKAAKPAKSPQPPSTHRASDPITEATASAATAITPAPAAVPKRVHIGDAMRRSGLDEFKVAEIFASVLDKLNGKTRGDGAVQKLLVDVLKECSRHLDPPRSEREAGPSVPVQFILFHEVARPDRSQQLAAQPAPCAAPPPPSQAVSVASTASENS